MKNSKIYGKLFILRLYPDRKWHYVDLFWHFTAPKELYLRKKPIKLPYIYLLKMYWAIENIF